MTKGDENCVLVAQGKCHCPQVIRALVLAGRCFSLHDQASCPARPADLAVPATIFLLCPSLLWNVMYISTLAQYHRARIAEMDAAGSANASRWIEAAYC